MHKSRWSEVSERPEETTAPGNGDRLPLNGKDAEIERLKRELGELRVREKRALAEVAEARERLSQLSAASRSFASSMRVRSAERERFKRRLAAQYAIGRVLAGAKNLDEAGPKIFTILAEELGWELGVLWKMDERAKVLRYGGGWHRSGRPPAGFEEACRHRCFVCGAGLPGRVWDRGEPAWVEKFATGSSSREDAAAAEGLRTALAFPIRTEDQIVAVFELFSREGARPEENMIRTAALVGDQIGQFVERRRTEYERDRSLARERAARQETSAILESITDAFIALDQDWRFTYINRAAKELVPAFGGDPERLLGKVLWEEFPTLKATKFGERLLQAAREGEATEYEEFYPELGKWFYGRIYPSEGGISGYFENITQRKRTEETLRTSEERLRQAIEIETVGVIFFDAEGLLTDANDAFLRMSGFDREDLERKLVSWQKMTPPEWMERSWQAFEELQMTGRTTPYEKEYIRKDGSRWWALFAAKLLDGGEGVEFIIDVTERKRTEDALRENEEWLRLAQQAARSGTWEWDLRSGDIRWSDEHRELFGFDMNAPVTREIWWASIHPDDLPHIEEAGRRCSEEGAEWPEALEYRISREGQTCWINARGRTVRDERDLPVRILGISVDVTELKRAEAERDGLRAQEWVARAEVAERERISRELHDRVAHSMGVAHQSLQLYEVFRENKPSQAAAKIELAKKMTHAALESTRNLSIELRRSEAEKGLVPALEDLLKVAVPAPIRTELDARGDESHVPPHVRGQLFAILREAVRNAVSHSEAKNLRIELDVTPQAAVCRVEDDGWGLPARKKTQDNRQAGVGLRSMRERVALLGGDFRLSSSPGEGTRVEVTVPLTEGV